MGKTIKKLKQKGTTLLEALVATAIIGIGFIAIFQMVTYAVRSIDVSGERTKINYLADMILEDIIAYKSSERDGTKLYDALIADADTAAGNTFWQLDTCNAPDDGIEVEGTAEENILNKWDNRFSNRRIKCVQANNDSKVLSTFTVCRDDTECSNQNNTVYDKLYLGKVIITVEGRTKNLYFRVH